MRVLAALWIALGLAAAGCSSPFGRQYEYEEQIVLDVDGSAEITVNASIPALIALRGLHVAPAMNRDAIAGVIEQAGCRNPRVGRPWTRNGRRFAQIRMAVEDVRELSRCGLLAWSSYEFSRAEGAITYTQEVGPPAGADPGPVNWTGAEIVGFKLHLPSRILFHNVKRLEDGANGTPERGNILSWEQYLRDRRQGKPLRMEVRMDSDSILYRAVRLFLGALAAAVVVLAGSIWLMIRTARRRARRA